MQSDRCCFVSGDAVHPLRQPDGRTERAAKGRGRRASRLRQPHAFASPDPDPRGDRIIGSCDLISERAWRYREGQTSALIAIPESAAEREHEARSELLEHLSEFDDRLLEELIEDREPPSNALYAISSRLV